MCVNLYYVTNFAASGRSFKEQYTYIYIFFFHLLKPLYFLHYDN